MPLFSFDWRREWDSNPRYAFCAYTPLAGARLRPARPSLRNTESLSEPSLVRCPARHRASRLPGSNCHRQFDSSTGQAQLGHLSVRKFLSPASPDAVPAARKEIPTSFRSHEQLRPATPFRGKRVFAAGMIPAGPEPVKSA